MVRLKLREIKSGKVLDKTLSGYVVRITPANIDRRSAQYIYNDDDFYYFMDMETYEQYPLSREQVADALSYLKEETVVDLIFYKGEAIAVELPITVELKVVETDPGLRGDTAQGGSKPARLETGLVVQVPLFIGEGETVKVDTRTGEYVGRA